MKDLNTLKNIEVQQYLKLNNINNSDNIQDFTFSIFFYKKYIESIY